MLLRLRTTARGAPPRSAARGLSDSSDSSSTLEEGKHALSTTEASRSLLALRNFGRLTTVDLAKSSQMSARSLLRGSLVPYVTLDSAHERSPIVPLRSDEPHLSHIQNGEKASFLIQPRVPDRIQPEEPPVPGLILIASCRPIGDGALVERVLQRFDTVHPGSNRFLSDASLFKFYALNPQEIFYRKCTQGFEQLDRLQFLESAVDPIAAGSADLLRELNDNHADALKRLFENYGSMSASDAFVLFCDRKGFSIMGRLTDGEKRWCELRLPLEEEVNDIRKYRECIESVLKEFV